MNETMIVLSFISICCLLNPFMGITSSSDMQREYHVEEMVPSSQIMLADSSTLNYYHGSFNHPNETIDQEQPTHCNQSIALSKDSGYYAQHFVPTYTILTRISLYLARNETFSQNATVSISIGQNLYEYQRTTFLDPDSVPENATWINISIPVMHLHTNHSYYIIGHLENQTDSGYIEWYFDIENTYPKGSALWSENTSQWKEIDMGKDYPDIDFCFRTIGVANVAPNQPALPDGPTEGQYGKSYSFTTIATDNNADTLYYQWDWGDGERSDWMGPYESGMPCTANHTWMVKGSYLIQVKAKDYWDVESPWSETLTIRMQKFKSIHQFFLKYYLFL